MEVPMQSAREPFAGRATAASAPRVSATNRTLVWFSGEAERRRRIAAAAQEEWSRPATTEPGRVGLDHSSYAEIRKRAEARRVAYLAALVRRAVAWLGARPMHVPAAATLGISRLRFRRSTARPHCADAAASPTDPREDSQAAIDSHSPVAGAVPPRRSVADARRRDGR
jgi:hypothetical protein